MSYNNTANGPAVDAELFQNSCFQAIAVIFKISEDNLHDERRNYCRVYVEKFVLPRKAVVFRFFSKIFRGERRL